MKTENKPFTDTDFREELTKLLPGYKWTVHQSKPNWLDVEATGIQSSGFNRLSTISVQRRRDVVWYTVKGYGHGVRCAKMGESCGGTLAKAVRGLQDYYANMSGKLASLERAIAGARKP